MHSLSNVLPLSNGFDRTQIPQFKQSLSHLLNLGVKTILLDFKAVSFKDSSGLGALIGALKSVNSVGGKLWICAMREEVKMLLELTNIDPFFEFLPDLDQGDSSFSGSIAPVMLILNFS
jgi:anti-anti-sigma factor